MNTDRVNYKLYLVNINKCLKTYFTIKLSYHFNSVKTNCGI